MKLLNEPYFIYASSSIISSGFGTVFASASDGSIYMQNDIGELYPLTESKGYINIVQITQSANAAWAKPGGLAYAHIICIGSGGGGGSGRQGAASSTRGGGGGGGGANVASIWFAASDLTSGVYSASIAGVTVGANSGSNAGVVSNGGTGGNGTFTQLQSGSSIIVSAPGGQGGGAGTTPGGAGGISANTPVVISQFALLGQIGGNGGTTANSSSEAFNGVRSCGAGGGGGGLTIANATQAGGSGSATYKYGRLIQTGSPGGAASGVGGGNGVNYLIDGLALIGFSSSLTSSFGAGTGGHAGGSGNTAGTIAGGVGGHGGSFGAGGGGGGASTTGATAGRGGNGAAGCIFIIEYY